MSLAPGGALKENHSVGLLLSLPPCGAQDNAHEITLPPGSLLLKNKFLAALRGHMTQPSCYLLIHGRKPTGPLEPCSKEEIMALSYFFLHKTFN